MIDIKEMDISLNGEKLFEKVSLSLPKKSFTVITGTSGIGKSTFLKSIYSINHHPKESIFYRGVLIEDMSEKEKILIKRKTGIVEQSPYSFKYLKVKDNIGYRCKDLGMYKEEVDSKIQVISRFLGIDEVLDSFPDEISGGQLQRMMIAMEAIIKPEYFFLDEPTSNLDTPNGLKVINLCLELRKTGSSIILVTHDQDIIEYLKSKEVTIYKVENRKLVTYID